MDLPQQYDWLSPKTRKTIREEYVKRQNGNCYHCKKPLTEKPCKTITKLTINKKLFPENFFDWPVHLHHDHVTGLTLGAVHCYCNAILWEYHGE